MVGEVDIEVLVVHRAVELDGGIRQRDAELLGYRVYNEVVSPCLLAEATGAAIEDVLDGLRARMLVREEGTRGDGTASDEDGGDDKLVRDSGLLRLEDVGGVLVLGDGVEGMAFEGERLQIPEEPPLCHSLDGGEPLRATLDRLDVVCQKIKDGQLVRGERGAEAKVELRSGVDCFNDEAVGPERCVVLLRDQVCLTVRKAGF